MYDAMNLPSFYMRIPINHTNFVLTTIATNCHINLTKRLTISLPRMQKLAIHIASQTKFISLCLSKLILVAALEV